MKHGLIVLAVVVLAGAPLKSAWAVEAVDFNKSIAPILADRCLKCHGPDSVQRKGGLRLDREIDAKKKVVVEGKPDESELIARVSSTDPERRMPPADAQKPALSAEELALFRQWVAEGAVWPKHWAFTSVQRPVVPQVKNSAWPKNDVDRFVLARLEREGLHPAPEATRETLIRRVSFDLTGLPPTLAEIEAFVSDQRPDAYELLVDRLMASPHYGERMALDWMDGARYADTNGFQNDFQRQMWPWRDWVIAKFNENMPFDEFTKEQIAGDLLPNANDSTRIGSGFNRNNRTTTEGGSIEEEWHVENLVDRVETTSNVFLGLTMGCCRCHDHKFDPITQKEFYRFFAFFNSTKDVGFYNETRGNVGPTVSLPTEENKQRIAELDGKVAEATKAVDTAKAAVDAGFDAWKVAVAGPEAAHPVAPVLEFPLRGNLYVAGSAAAPTYAGAGGPVWKEGLLGPSLELDGTADSHVNAGDAIAFLADKPFSVSVWIRPEAEGSIFSRMDDENSYRGVDLLLGKDGKFSLHMVSQWPGNALKVTSSEALPMSVWSQVVITSNGSGKAKGIAAFVDGHEVDLKTEVDALNGPIDTAQPVRLGRRSASAFFKGGIAAFSVFDRNLTKDEVNQVMRASLAEAVALAPGDEHTAALQGFYKLSATLDVKDLQDKLEDTKKAKSDYVRDKVPSVMVMEEAEKPRETYRLVRGQYDQPDKSELLQPGLPAFLPPMPAGAPNNRLGLAEWLVDPSNPLTSRVFVNRLWAKFFGEGFVKTLDNFGMQSEAPSNQALLDFLASTFVSMHWDMKQLQKLIVTSAAYRQSSAVSEELIARDPDNLLVARGPRFRLSAELIRDNALAVSGLLSDKIGGPSVKPYQPEGLWAELAGGAGEGPYVQGTGEDLYRRSLYTYRKRTVSHPTVATFDAPSWEVCRVYRARTNTPLQALALLNDTTYVEAARNLAQRLITEAQPDVNDRVRLGFRLVTGRIPNETEEKVLFTGATGYLNDFKSDPAAADKFISHGDSKAPDTVDHIELAAYTAVSEVLLNMDTAITKE